MGVCGKQFHLGKPVKISEIRVKESGKFMSKAQENQGFGCCNNISQKSLSPTATLTRQLQH
jgi:hypothetical protein